MIVIEDKKYACETCIKGHRSSACKHTERPLFEIKKKGRPVTQCEHCRELRKTKQVHVKCVCQPTVADTTAELIQDAKGQLKKVAKKVLPSAAFPHGLPGASLARPDTAPSCNCQVGESCSCCTQRTRHPTKVRRATMSEAMPPTADLLAKAHFRPVLPRPAPELAAPQPRTGPIHGIGQPSRYPVHENLFSPYGRAYEYARSSSTVSDMDAAPSHVHRDVSPGDMPVSPSPVSAMDYDGAMSWPPSVTSYTPAACGCGPSCACPGCLEHSAQPNPATFSYDTCVNPEQCSACLSCAVNSMPVSMPQETASLQGQSMEFLPPGLPSNQTQQQIFDWLESVPPQMYAPPPGPPPSDPAYPMYAQQAWSAPQLPSYSQPLGQNGAGRCCDGGCMCAPGQCTCEGHERLTFATSGMRAACCGPPTSVSATDLVTPRGRSDSVSSGAASSSSFPTRGPPLSNDAPFMLAQAEGSVPSFYDYDYALSTSSGSSSLSRSPSITSLQSLGSVDSGGQAPRVGYPMGDRQSTLMPTTDGDGYQLRRERTLMPEGFPLGDRQRTLMPDEEARKDRSFVQRARAFVKSCRPGSTRAVPAPVVIHSGHGQRPGQGHDRDGSPSSMHMGAVQMDTPYDTMQLP